MEKTKSWFKKKKKNLSGDAVAATRLGLSYGQYKWRQSAACKGVKKSGNE